MLSETMSWRHITTIADLLRELRRHLGDVCQKWPIKKGLLLLIDNAELRQQFVEITRKPVATAPGFAIVTHGPDDMADASVMAITEAQSPKQKAPVVHEFGVWDAVITEHQKVTMQTLSGGAEVPSHYIGK